MGLWPFGGGKKRHTSRTEDPGRHSLVASSLVDSTRQPSAASEESATMARTTSSRAQNGGPRRLSKQRIPSQAQDQASWAQPVAGPGVQSGLSEKRASGHGPSIYSQNPLSQSSIGPGDFTALPQVPTLLAKRSGYDPTLTRRKSSKRKAEDYAREREIRAMSAPTHALKRPVTYSGSGPLVRDTRQVPGDLNRRLQRPASEVSLPLAETVQEAVAANPANQASFKIGIFAALSPRPTLTYVANRQVSAEKHANRIKPSVQQAIEEEPVTSKKRIDELADELDAGGLRELMERDRRRHERKKAQDRDRLQRKLQRKADKQREEEMRGRQLHDRPVDTVGLGLQTPQVAEPPPVEHPTPSDDKARDPFADPDRSRNHAGQPIRNPFENEKDVDLLQQSFLDDDEDEEPPVPVRSPLRPVPPVEIKSEPKPAQAATISPPTSPIHRPTDRQSLSQTSARASDLIIDAPEPAPSDRRPSDQSGQQVSSWTSFFKRGGRRKGSAADRGRSTPSEFSNTSRESFARKQQPPPVVVPRTFRRSDAASVPQRTMSKFREDLPELPISPPDSRVQSPEIMNAPPVGAGLPSGRQPRASMSGTLDGRSVATSSSTAAVEKAPSDSRYEQGADLETNTHASMTLSQSLASVDSEGSWLSGKPSKRLSGGMSHPLRQSQSSIPPPAMPGAFEVEEEGLANDDYLNRLTPGPRSAANSITSGARKASSTVIDLERERQEEDVPDIPPVPAHQGRDETWHEGLGRQATLVRQPTRARSKEGILRENAPDTPDTARKLSSDGETGDDSSSREDEDNGAELQQAPILRARSVEYKGHARQISAGSARLLDIRGASMPPDAPPRSPTVPAQNAPSAQDRKAATEDGRSHSLSET